MENQADKVFDEILRPDYAERKKALIDSKSKLVHYTSADSAFKIIQSKMVWLRQTKLMNDYSEVEYGINQLFKAYDNPSIRKKFEHFFKSISSTAKSDLEAAYNAKLNSLKYETYVLSIAEHALNENDYGRLSMWRAYGRQSGVALVVNPEYVEDAESKLQAYALPTQYLNESQFYDFIDNMIQRCIDNLHEFQKLEPSNVVQMVLYNFAYIGVATKHPGFSEEKEWRVIANPSYFGKEGLTESVESINGIPQKVLKLPLDRKGTELEKVFNLDNLISRVIIGPSDAAYEIADAISFSLRDAGVNEPGKRIHVSNIPYRD